MLRLRLDDASLPADLRDGVRAVVADRPERFGGDVAVRFGAPSGGERRAELVVRSPREVEIRGATRTDALRALGRLLGQDAPAAFVERARIATLGVMLDQSRNGVLTPAAARALLVRFALMGVNQAILYCEDTFPVDGEAFFGYLRGGWTRDELRALDDHAHALGIELQLCIQTLGHLEQVLQWPAYAANADTAGILLVDDEPTYALIDRWIGAAAACVRSRTLHVGMDEAAGLGTGRYKRLKGERPPFAILNRHLTRIRALCAKHGVRATIMGDTYFRLGAPSGHYYDPGCVIGPEVARDIPRDVRLCYWDYYHRDEAFYRDWIARHRALGHEPLVWTGVWTWCRLWAALRFSLDTVDAAMRACKASGIAEVAACLWGDDGAECDLWSALPGLQFFAEHAYADAVDPQLLRANLRGTCGIAFDDWVRASDVDLPPGTYAPPQPPIEFGMEWAPVVGKWLLWQDPALSFADPQLPTPPRAHYERLAADLDAAAATGGVAERLRFPATLARVLALKSSLRGELHRACVADDRARAGALATGELAALRAAVDELWKRHRALWLSLYRPFGLEVIDGRYGALLARLDTLALRVGEFAAGRADAPAELTTSLHRAWDARPDRLPEMMHLHHRLMSPSMMK